MNALLILLGAFSLTLLMSNSGFFKKAHSFSYISIPLILGLAFSPEGLVPILPSTRENLSWALRVALTWIAFLSGAEMNRFSFGWSQTKKLVPFYAAYLLFFGVSFLLVGAVYYSDNSFEVLGVSMMASAALFSSRENPFLLAILFVSLFFMLDKGIHTFEYKDLLYPLAIGVLLGVVFRLIFPPKEGLDTPIRLTLLGLCVLGTGWVIGIGSLEVLMGLSLGWVTAFNYGYGVCRDPSLNASEGPILLVVPFFAGLYLHLNSEVILIGSALAVFRLLIKFMLLKTGMRDASRSEVLEQIIPISHLALPITLCLHLSGYSNENTLFILNCFCVGFVVNDLFALTIESFSRRSLKREEEVAYE
ncbi:MAG: hypothetical protein CL676_06885 [Bdellovibrionaceae bacterium]|nr:hypothetical protein [Pseudobdellovibrionaceae bacterium]